MADIDKTSEDVQMFHLAVVKSHDNGKQSEQRQIMNTSWKEYSQRSTIHGISYLGERELHWTERIWWILALCTSISVSFYCIFKVYAKLTPVVITFADYTTPITEINFPTITICNDVIMPGVLKYNSQEDVQQMYALINVCEDGGLVSKYANFTIDTNVIMQHLRTLTPDLFHCDFTQHCAFHEYSYFYCGTAFQEILTDVGLCYTFNHLKSEDIYRK